jgi:acetoin utilization protein AcuC
MPVLVASEIFRRSHHAPGHPLAIPRVSLTIDLVRALGWLPAVAYREAAAASVDELARFHDPAYIAAVAEAEATQHLSTVARDRFNLGINGNALHAEIFRRPATACGASLTAAQLLAGGGIVYSPAGGTHHGQRARASGYCIFNDPVLAILELKRHGCERVFYLDLDAHWGDGVQMAFAQDAGVFTLSIHEAGRWPMTRRRREAPPGRADLVDADLVDADPGGVDDRAGGVARNLPLPPGANDDELTWVMENAVLPLIERFTPDAIVVQGGCDGLADDPMTRLAYSNRGLWRAIAAVVALAPRLLVLGGGGYNPYAVARCWAGIWATLNGHQVPDRLPAAAEAVLAGVQWSHRLGRDPKPAWRTALADSWHCGPIHDEVRRIAAGAVR